MKQKRVLQVGDKVKYVGVSDDLFRCGKDWLTITKVVGEHIHFIHPVDISQVHIIHRRQVTHVRYKKKPVKVISDERFYMIGYLDNHYVYCSGAKNVEEAKQRVASSATKFEILELGIIARHQIK